MIVEGDENYIGAKKTTGEKSASVQCKRKPGR